jgi:hypothetical protein
LSSCDDDEAADDADEEDEEEEEAEATAARELFAARVFFEALSSTLAEDRHGRGW